MRSNSWAECRQKKIGIEPMERFFRLTFPCIGHFYDRENRGHNQDNVYGIYFGLQVKWLTDLTVQTVFGEMGRERDLAE